MIEVGLVAVLRSQLHRSLAAGTSNSHSHPKHPRTSEPLQPSNTMLSRLISTSITIPRCIQACSRQKAAAFLSSSSDSKPTPPPSESERIPRALREPAAPTDPKWWRQELARSIEEGRPRPAMVRQYATITSYAWGFVGVSLLVSWLLLDRLRKRQEQKQHHQQQHHRDTGAQQSSQ